MANQRARPLLAVLAAGLLLAGCDRVEGHVIPGALPASRPASSSLTLAPRPPMTKGAFPCSDCHEPDLPTKTTRRALTKAHAEITLAHAGEAMWCWDCHDVKNRDSLRTIQGALHSYDEAHLVCGQCHGHVLRDWNAGAHGKRTGHFEGPAEALRCASCHDAHAPHFKPLTPASMPARPKRTP